MTIWMIFYRAFQNSYRTVVSVWWKSAICSITIFVGAMAITTSFTISQNVDSYVDYLVNENGGAKITAMAFGENEVFTQKHVRSIASDKNVQKIFLTDNSNLRVRSGNDSSMTTVIPVNLGNRHDLGIKLVKGSLLSVADVVDSSNSVFISLNLQKQLNLDFPVGKQIFLRNKHQGEVAVKIIGVGELKGNSYDRGSMWVSEGLYKEVSGKKGYGFINVVSKDAYMMNWSEKFVNKMLEIDGFKDFWINNPFKRFMDEKDQLAVFIQMGYTIGLLALIAGSIGSTSVMILNINLRKKEIGLYKALGFSSKLILLQICCETALMSLFGGIIGAMVGSMLGLDISKDIFPIAQISLQGILLGFTSALVTGIIFGLIPAGLAARMDPVKALQG
jgi:ABC-type antimicrobial peptide transport system permease subunit